MNFPLPTIENTPCADRLLSELFASNDDLRLAGFALQISDIASLWSISIISEERYNTYTRRDCARATDAVQALFSSRFLNARCVGSCITYLPYPITHSSQYRYQFLIDVEQVPDPGSSQPTSETTVTPKRKRTITKFAPFKQSSELLDSKEEFIDPLLKASHLLDPTDTEKFRLRSAESLNSITRTRSNSFTSTNSSDDKRSLVSSDEDYLLRKRSYYSCLYITLDNVETINEYELKRYASPRKQNLFYALKRKKQRIDALTRAGKIARLAKKFSERLLLGVVTGDLKPWHAEYAEHTETILDDYTTTNVLHQIEERHICDLVTLRAVTLLATCSRNLSKRQLLRRQMAQNYLLTKGIVLKTDLGNLNVKLLQTLLAEKLKLKADYAFKLEELDFKFGRFDKGTPLTFEHEFCSHD